MSAYGRLISSEILLGLSRLFRGSQARREIKADFDPSACSKALRYVSNPSGLGRGLIRDLGARSSWCLGRVRLTFSPEELSFKCTLPSLSSQNWSLSPISRDHRNPRYLLSQKPKELHLSPSGHYSTLHAFALSLAWTLKDLPLAPKEQSRSEPVDRVVALIGRHSHAIF